MAKVKEEEKIFSNTKKQMCYKARIECEKVGRYDVNVILEHNKIKKRKQKNEQTQKSVQSAQSKPF